MRWGKPIERPARLAEEKLMTTILATSILASTTGMRLCPHCNSERTANLFQVMRSGRPGGWCRPCRTQCEKDRRIAKGILPRPQSKLIGDGKLCIACQEVKLLDQFSPSDRGRGGVAAYCRECHQNKFPATKEKIRERTRAYRIRHRKRHLASPCEHVAQADGQLSIEEWHHPEQHGNFVGWRQYRHML